MIPVVYLDILFIVNLVINFILLWTTSKVSRTKTSRIRLFVGAFIGAIYAVIMFFPAFRIYYTIIAKFLFSMLLIAVTYNIEKVKTFLKVLGCFYLVSFTFGGAALALFYFTNVGAFVGALLSNGIIYFQLPWKTLLISVVIAYVVISITWRVVHTKLKKEQLYIPLSIMFDKKSIHIHALVDTGNTLYDPISNLPVIVVEFQAVKELLPIDIQHLFKEYKEEDLMIIYSVISNSNWISRFRLIPFSSLGKENGMLIGFKPDEIEICEGDQKKDVRDIIVAIYNKKLTNDEKYTALLHPEIIA